MRISWMMDDVSLWVDLILVGRNNNEFSDGGFVGESAYRVRGWDDVI